jgi:hypothetical protein
VIALHILSLLIICAITSIPTGTFQFSLRRIAAAFWADEHPFITMFLMIGFMVKVVTEFEQMMMSAITAINHPKITAFWTAVICA